MAHEGNNNDNEEEEEEKVADDEEDDILFYIRITWTHEPLISININTKKSTYLIFCNTRVELVLQYILFFWQ